MAVVQYEFRGRVLALDKEFGSKKIYSCQVVAHWVRVPVAARAASVIGCLYLFWEGVISLSRYLVSNSVEMGGRCKPCQQLALVTVTNCSICHGGGEGKLFQVQQSKCQT